MQQKLKKVHSHYLQMESGPPSLPVTQHEWKKMSKMEVLKSIADREGIANLVEASNNCERKIPITSMNLHFNPKQSFYSFEEDMEMHKM